MSKAAEEYLESINCFNTIYLKRDSESNTLAKILKAYAQQLYDDNVQLKKQNKHLRGLLKENGICYKCGSKDNVIDALCFKCVTN